MKVRIETDDEKEALQMVMAGNLAAFIWELKHNYWRKYKYDESNFTLSRFKDDLQEMLEEFGIDIDALTE